MLAEKDHFNKFKGLKVYLEVVEAGERVKTGRESRETVEDGLIAVTVPGGGRYSLFSPFSTVL